jgi:rRNA maturation endonuclease Nob1
MDLPRAELLVLAERTINRYNGKANVYFKFTCIHCGTRCALTEPNVLYEKGECFNCGKETVILRGGFLLQIGV